MLTHNIKINGYMPDHEISNLQNQKYIEAENRSVNSKRTKNILESKKKQY